MAVASKDKSFMAPELRREREASQLDVPELTTFNDGGEMISEKRKKMCKYRWAWQASQLACTLCFPDELVCSDPVFNSEDKYFLNGEEAFDRAMEKSVHYIKKCRELNLQGLEKNILKK